MIAQPDGLPVVASCPIMKALFAVSLTTLFASVAAVFTAPGMAAEPGASRANLLLVTVDTLRPDALGFVAGKNQTPAIDELARGGVRFEAAASPVPITLPAHTSILTGLVPRRHGVRDNGQLVGEGFSTLPEVLAKRGYATAAFVSGFPLAPQFGLDRGFGRYDDRFTAGRARVLERRAGETNRAALEWLATAPEPWLLWVHYYEPHDPYEPPAELRGSGPRGAYDGEVRVVDRALGELLAGVRAKAKAPLLTVFTADHGESLGEHGEATHGFFIYESTTAVPLVVHFPGRLEPRESRAQARLVDVVPTALELLGLPPLPGIDGVSLVPALDGKAQQVPAALLESQRAWRSYGWAPLKAVRSEGFKLIVAPRPELYDLGKDPAETRNLVDADRRRARELADLLRGLEATPEAASTSATDAETEARLRALGYAGAGGVSTRQPPPDAADPKDRIGLWNRLGDAEIKMEQADFPAAVVIFDEVLAKDPANGFALGRSGVALSELGRLPEAIGRFERAAATAPDDAEVRAAWAVALVRAKRLQEAEKQWLETIRLQPRRASAWVQLGNTLGLLRQPEKAVEAMTRAVELAPDDTEIRIRLAFAQFGVGRLAPAAANLEAAAEAIGPDFPHNASLGLVLIKLGRFSQAREWILKSKEGEPDFPMARIELARLELEVGNREAARRALRQAVEVAPYLRDRLAVDAVLGPLLR